MALFLDNNQARNAALLDYDFLTDEFEIGLGATMTILGDFDFSGANAITGVLQEANGGTGESAYAVGDLLTAEALNDLDTLAIGNEDDVLTVVDVGAGVLKPRWSAPAPIVQSLQGAYEGGNDITVSVAEGGGVTIDGTPDEANTLLTLTGGVHTGGTAENLLSLVTDDQATGYALDINNIGSGNALNVKDNGTPNLTVNGAGAVSATPTSGQNLTLTAAGAGVVDINAGAGGVDVDVTSGDINLATNTAGNIVGSSAGGIDFDTADGAFTVDTVNGGISLDSDSASNFTVTGAVDLTVKSTAGSTIVEGGEAVADAVQITATNAAGGVDINAGTGGIAGDTTGGISLDAAAASNLSTSSGDLTIAATTNSVNITGAEAAADAVKIEATNAAGGLDMNAGTAGATLDSTGAISLDAAEASNFTVTGAGKDLTLSSAGGSAIVTASEGAADAVQITASDSAGGVDINAGTGGIAADTTGAASIGAGAASDFTVANANLTLETTGAGITDVKSATEVQVSTVLMDVNASGAIQQDAGAESWLKTSAGDVTLEATAASANITGGEAAADAVAINASNAAGGIDVNAGTAGITMDSTGAFSGDFVGASNLTTDSGNLTIENTTSGNLYLDSAGTANLGLNSTATNIGKSGTLTSILGNMDVAGDLVVQGTTTTVKSEEVNIADNVVVLNQGNTVSVSGEECGEAGIYLATATNTNTAGTGVFTPANPGVANANLTVAASVFSAGDIINITGSQYNDGLYEVDSDAAGVLTIRGLGLVGNTQGFFRNDFTTETNTGVTITKVNVSLDECDDAGDWRTGKGSTTVGWTWNYFAVEGGTSLQDAYDAGNTIVTAGGNDLDVSGTEAISLDAQKASNFTVTGAADLTLNSTAGSTIIDGGEAVADAVQITASNGAGGVDINAGTGGIAGDTTGAISLDAAQASNLTVTGAADLTVSTSAGSLNLTGGEAAADAVKIEAGNAAGGIDMNSGTAGMTMDSTGGFSGDFAAASNLSTSSGDMTIAATTNSLNLTGAEAAADAVLIDATNAAGGVTVNSGTGGTTIDSDGAISILNGDGELTITQEDAAEDVVVNLGDAAGATVFAVKDSAAEEQFTVNTSGAAKVESSYGFTSALAVGDSRFVNGGMQVYVDNQSGVGINEGDLLYLDGTGDYTVAADPDLTTKPKTCRFIAAEAIANGNKGWAWAWGSQVTCTSTEALTEGAVVAAYNDGTIVNIDSALLLAGMEIQPIGFATKASLALATATICFNPMTSMILK